MSDSSNPEGFPQAIAPEFVEGFMPGAWSEVSEVIREIFARLPYGERIHLSNGREFEIKKFVEPRLNDSGRWEFGFDAIFPDAKPGQIDHLEFFTRHSGGGGSLAAPVADTD